MRNLIKIYDFDVPFQKNHVEQANILTGWNFTGYKRIKNFEYLNNSLRIAITDDGEKWECWSWMKAIDGISDAKNLAQAMRNAVRDQINQFKETCRQKCEICGSVENLSVDHKSRSFDSIKKQFVLENTNISSEIRSDGCGWYISDPCLLEKWRLFHLEKSDLQILCVSCNSKKGAKALCP
jgi:hypothetical protein